MKNNVKITRIKRSLTQQQLAQKVGVTRQTIGLIEKGEYNPSLQLCIAIAKALNQTLDELFWEVEES
ncbi:helix-turn-helix transcriptional regulator [Metabacillus malikii]|uniref:Transcriptional regulator n=1 Tax=Metabacillus malikii TaxID=1504265 RepID=A0ABT9ZCX7_9BACI|nr:helix-turn-helix transcriptional regulator [Metabacillus malikii]MDQ0229789.1 putative transcriptional regulator [Metabacillus malikii]